MCFSKISTSQVSDFKMSKMAGNRLQLKITVEQLSLRMKAGLGITVFLWKTHVGRQEVLRRLHGEAVTCVGSMSETAHIFPLNLLNLLLFEG